MGSVILSVLALGGLALALPFAVARMVPEGVGWLVVNGVLSAAVMVVVSAGYFVAAYAWAAEGPVLRMIGAAPGSVWHFLRLGAMSGIVWGPIVVLAVAQQPRRWKEKVW